MGKRKFIFIAVLSIMVISFTIIFLTSCTNIREYKPIEYSGGPNYATYAQNEGTGHFSVEYPVGYKPGSLTDPWFIGEYRGQSLAIVGQFSENYHSTVFYINCYKIGAPLPDIDSAINLRISQNEEYARNGAITNYKIFDKNSVLVSGVKGKEIAFSFTALPIIAPDLNIPTNFSTPYSEFEKYIFIAQRDLIWEINLSCDGSQLEQAQIDFNHILQTLRILP
jgi:hypothetical protein